MRGRSNGGWCPGCSASSVIYCCDLRGHLPLWTSMVDRVSEPLPGEAVGSGWCFVGPGNLRVRPWASVGQAAALHQRKGAVSSCSLWTFERTCRLCVPFGVSLSFVLAQGQLCVRVLYPPTHAWTPETSTASPLPRSLQAPKVGGQVLSPGHPPHAAAMWSEAGLAPPAVVCVGAGPPHPLALLGSYYI